MKICSLFFICLLCFAAHAFTQDTLAMKDSALQTDSVPVVDSAIIHSDTIAIKKTAPVSLKAVLDSNRFINFNSPSENYIEKEKKRSGNEFLFYLILGIFFFFGILKLIYNRYIGIVFRVFFNTSLRQSQLTDQLLQLKLPSMLLNLFFAVMSGIYIFLMLRYYGFVTDADKNMIGLLVLAVAIIYLGKFIVLKFIGWVSGYNQEADTYVFVVFLISKILSIILMPVVLILAFAEKNVAYVTLILSWFIIILLFLLRYLRSYSLLQKRLSINRVHFLLYIIGVEIIPLLLLYKIAERILVNYL